MHRLLLVAAAPLATLFLGACGGGGSGPATFSLVGGEVKDDSEWAATHSRGDEVVSPGPTIRVRAGQRTTISFKNVHGRYFGETYGPHNLLVTATKDEQAKPLWKAAIGETDFLAVGERGSVTFTPDNAARTSTSARSQGTSSGNVGALHRRGVATPRGPTTSGR